jgi:hypothetical protein
MFVLNPQKGTDDQSDHVFIHSKRKTGAKLQKKMRSAQRISVGVPRVSFRLFDGRPEAPALAAHYQVNEKEGFAMTWRQR